MSDFRVLVTGSRTTTPQDDAVVIACLKRVCEPSILDGRPVVIIEGDCPNGGVDVTARQWGSITPGVRVETYPAQWHKHGKAAGMIRNQAMVDTGAHICLAFPAPGSIGTWDCLKKAALAGIPGRVYPITGSEPAPTIPGV